MCTLTMRAPSTPCHVHPCARLSITGLHRQGFGCDTMLVCVLSVQGVAVTAATQQAVREGRLSSQEGAARLVAFLAHREAELDSAAATATAADSPPARSGHASYDEQGGGGASISHSSASPSGLAAPRHSEGSIWGPAEGAASGLPYTVQASLWGNGSASGGSSYGRPHASPDSFSSSQLWGTIPAAADPAQYQTYPQNGF